MRHVHIRVAKLRFVHHHRTRVVVRIVCWPSLIEVVGRVDRLGFVKMVVRVQIVIWIREHLRLGVVHKVGVVVVISLHDRRLQETIATVLERLHEYVIGRHLVRELILTHQIRVVRVQVELRLK